MVEAFDTGPLSWVKDEIDQSLVEAKAHYADLASNLTHVDGLQMALSHLQQVEGALDMIGLSGPTRFCQEIIAVTEQVKSKALVADDTLVNTVTDSLDSLLQYLHDLMHAVPDLPLRLYSPLCELAALQGKEIDKQVLFFPDVSYRPPSDLPSREAPSTSLPLFIGEQRKTYQKALIDWLLSQDAAAITRMQEALSAVQRVQEKPVHVSLWWAAATLMDCLKQTEIAQMPAAKKVCRKLDQQLRDLATGESKRSQALLAEILYLIGLSEAETTDIQRVKDTFDLDGLLHGAEQYPLEPQQKNDPWQQILNAYQQALPELKRDWERLTELLWHVGADAAIDQDLLVALTKRNQSLLEQSIAYRPTEQEKLPVDILQLSQAINQVFQHLAQENSVLDERTALAVASALAMLERMLVDTEKYDESQQQATVSQLERLQQLVNTPSSEDLNEAPQPYEDDEVTRAVAQQVIECLLIIEKSVDRFFRAANETGPLAEAIQQLKPVVAAFDMLEMSTPKTIAKSVVIYLEQFAANALPDATAHPHQPHFETVAEGISLLGLYAHDLPEVRPEVKQAMSTSLMQLEQGMDDLMVNEEVDQDNHQAQEAEALALAPEDELETYHEAPALALESEADHQEIVLGSSPIPAEATATYNLTPVVERGIDDELQSIFVSEAEELLEHNRLNLAALRANLENEIALAEVRRAYHTLKGSGRTVGLEVLAEVAYSIEKLLNVLLENKLTPTRELIDFVSLCNQSFFDWVETLKEAGQVTLNAGEYQQQADEMAALLQQSLQAAAPKAKNEEVIIGGSRKVGRAFFYLFLGEAQQHLNTLVTTRKAIEVGSIYPPSASSKRAAHTLSSNALTAGFDAIGDLARALENWFDEFYGPWTEKHLNLLNKVVNALKDGIEKAKKLEHPKSSRSLIIELSKTTAAMQLEASKVSETVTAEKNNLTQGLSDDERLGTSLSADEITVSRMTDDDAPLPDALLEESSAVDEGVEVSFIEEGSDAHVVSEVASKPQYSLKPPAFLPEDEMLKVVDAFNFEPDALQTSEALPDSAPEEHKDEQEESAETTIALTPPELDSVVELSISEEAPVARAPKLVQPASDEPAVINEQEQPQPPKPEVVKPSLVNAVLSAGDAVQSKPVLDEELARLFIEEADELLPNIGQQLRLWKNAPQDDQPKVALQRYLHTLKGSARTAGQSDIGDQAHALEDKLALWANKQPKLNDFDALFVDYDRISLLVDQLRSGLNKFSEQEVLADEITGVEVDAEADESSGAVSAHITDSHESALTSPYLRVRASQLDQLISEAGEVSILRSRLEREVHGLKEGSKDLTLSVSRLRTYLNELELEADAQLQSRMTELKENEANFDPLELDRFTKLQELTRLMAESLHDITTIQQGLVGNIDQSEVALIQQNRMNREVQKGLMTVRMMPFSSIAERLRRIVRQVSRELGKQVNLQIEGESVELDRGVLEQIGAPLEHLLRNAVVHGIEMPAERVAAGKPETGTVTLTVVAVEDEVKLNITDDGRGIDLAQVQALAAQRGLLKQDQVVTDETLIAVVFESGFTTRENVSQDAGRGVGLDAVKSDIAALNGRIDLTNTPGSGLAFDIFLPVSMSVTQVLIVKVNEQQYAIPAVMIEQVQTLKQAALAQAYAEQAVEWNDQRYPLHFFARLLGDMDYVAKNQAYTPMIFLRSGQYNAVIHVDEVVGNQEIVMKPLGTQLSRVPGISGASVLGDGAIVYVMNPVQLAHREILSTGVSIKQAAPVEKVKKLALVVDDSLTMRKALSRILEKDGMEVVTANDGIDAMQKLADLQPDVVLTDIEMPRMDGFELAKQLRESDKTRFLPLVMISSRSANKHHEHAKAVGVNAFLGKPVQDDVLLQAVHTLMPS